MGDLGHPATYAPDWNVGVLPLVLPLQLAVAAWGAWGALRSDPRRLLRNVLVAFALTFFVLYGWHFLLSGGDLVSIGNLLYLAAAAPLAVSAVYVSAIGDPRGSAGVRVVAPTRRVRAGATALGLVFFAADGNGDAPFGTDGPFPADDSVGAARIRQGRHPQARDRGGRGREVRGGRLRRGGTEQRKP